MTGTFQSGHEGSVEFALLEDGQSFIGGFAVSECWNGRKAVPDAADATPKARTSTPQEALRSILILTNRAIFNGDANALSGAAHLVTDGIGGQDEALSERRRRLMWQIMNMMTVRLLEVPETADEAGGDIAHYRVSTAAGTPEFEPEFRKLPELGWQLLLPPSR